MFYVKDKRTNEIYKVYKVFNGMIGITFLIFKGEWTMEKCEHFEPYTGAIGIKEDEMVKFTTDLEDKLLAELRVEIDEYFTFGEGYVCLDGDFTIEQLEKIILAMKQLLKEGDDK